jgi:hypothetical protein
MNDTIDQLCPHCAVRGRVPREYAGKKIKCQRCGHDFVTVTAVTSAIVRAISLICERVSKDEKLSDGDELKLEGYLAALGSRSDELALKALWVIGQALSQRVLAEPSEYIYKMNDVFQWDFTLSYTLGSLSRPAQETLLGVVDRMFSAAIPSLRLGYVIGNFRIRSDEKGYALSALERVRGRPRLIAELSELLVGDNEYDKRDLVSALRALKWSPSTPSERAAELVARYQFDKAAELGPVGLDFIERAVPTKEQTFFTTSSHDQHLPEGVYREAIVHLTRGERAAALVRLCDNPNLARLAVTALTQLIKKRAENLANTDLQDLRDLMDARETQWRSVERDDYYDYFENGYQNISCAEIRDLAKQELRRRGMC